QRLATEEKQESARQKTLERELEWVRLAPRARQAKSKARLQAYEKMLAEEGRERVDNVEIYIPPGPRLGNVVIEAEHLRKGYGDGFNFRGADQQKRVKDLSGGERNRVHLARVLKSGANVLLLDEPTKDLDVDTLRALEDAVLGFAGCVVVISHDRWFLDRIAT